MIDSSVLLPDPEAPTIATDSPRARAKSISWRIVSVPVESCTLLGETLDGDDGFGHERALSLQAAIDAPALARAL